MIFSATLAAQNLTETSTSLTEEEEVTKVSEEEEEDGPRMFVFEPDFEDQNAKRKAEIAHTRSIIDTLDVSERKRLKLLRDLYKNGVSKRLQKALLVENNYEDFENEEQ